MKTNYHLIRNCGIILIMLLSLKSYSQTYNEWFRQKKTQKKYLVQQIAALQAFAGTLEKGYKVAKKGLEAARTITNGEFSLHRDFLGSLAKVSPFIAESKEIAAFIQSQRELGFLLKEARNETKGLNTAEKDYIKGLLNAIEKEALQNGEHFKLLLSEEGFQLSDKERLSRIRNLAKSCAEVKVVLYSIWGAMREVLDSREKEKREAVKLNNLYGFTD